VNTGEPTESLAWAEGRVLEIQTKLHRWAAADPQRRFSDLFNLVADPAFLLVAWDRRVAGAVRGPLRGRIVWCLLQRRWPRRRADRSVVADAAHLTGVGLATGSSVAAAREGL